MINLATPTFDAAAKYMYPCVYADRDRSKSCSLYMKDKIIQSNRAAAAVEIHCEIYPFLMALSFVRFRRVLPMIAGQCGRYWKACIWPHTRIVEKK